MRIGRSICSHMERYVGDAKYIIPFPEQPWNAWAIYENGFEKPYTGLYYRVLLHLEKCKEVDEKLKQEIREELKEVEKKLAKLTSK